MNKDLCNILSDDIDPAETREWLESLEYTLQAQGPERVRYLLAQLQQHVHQRGMQLPFSANTPYINSIHVQDQPAFPGSREMERRIKNIIRWNAMAMVTRANVENPGIGGHISTYASAATLYEVGFNHFFRAPTESHPGDFVYFQGHASPGIYARAFLEGRLTELQLEHFRRELATGGGVSSYPHPWLMPDFWQFPTVSMGLAPIMSIYHARFVRYMEDRGLVPHSDSKFWVFMGDGESDEPESLGALGLAAREGLDNLIFVVNCNLQRLDGPVRGNGKIIQELEGTFRGAGWNVIKVIWGDSWDPLLAKDDGLLVRRMMEVVDGQYQKYAASTGAYIRQDFFGAYPALLKLVEHHSDEDLVRMRRGGHDPEKVYAAFKAAVEHQGNPTVILAKTIKGYGLGLAGESRNVAHNQKKLNEEELKDFRSRFSIPIEDQHIAQAPFYKPPEDSKEIQYLRQRREALGGYLPARQSGAAQISTPPLEDFAEYLKGTDGHEVSTTMVFVRMLSRLLRDEHIGKLIVPIIPDEARTFGMEPMFRQCGIYAHHGQLYEPVDHDMLLYYREAKDGQIIEEGITEAGSLSSFIAAGTAYSNHGINMIPFYAFYSMFGMQRVGDLLWAAAEMRTKGFLLGGTAGRTTLSGEGLQHEDGHSHLLAYPIPNLKAYDPAFAYELAVIIQDGLKRMYTDREDIFYYITLMNENYAMPAMPAGVEEGIRRGIYQLDPLSNGTHELQVQLLGSGTILLKVLEARDLLAERFGVAAKVYSVTSWKELYRDALACERGNRLHPETEPRRPYIATALHEGSGPIIAATDYMKALPDSVARFVPGGIHSLGTDGFGRSDTRAGLRRHFEVDAESIAIAALYALALQGKFETSHVARAINELGIETDKADPWLA